MPHQYTAEKGACNLNQKAQDKKATPTPPHIASSETMSKKSHST